MSSLMSKNHTDSTVIKDEIYPYIVSLYNETTFKKVMSRFINKRSEMLYDICPCDRLSFMGDDRDDFFNSFKIDKSKVRDMLEKTFYWNDAKFRAMVAKDEFSVCVICIIRYLYLKNDIDNLKLAQIYLSFSGKFYPSMHSKSFPIAPTQYRYIMEYTINNKLTSKFDLKREGSVIKAIQSLSNTWISTYEDEMNEFSDDDVAYMLLQLQDRIKSTLKNIASEFYDSFNNREYITYDTDSEDENNFHKADSNSQYVNQLVEKTMNTITSTDINYKVCKYVSDSNVKTDEIKCIIENIVQNNSNLPIVRELCSLVISDYMEQYKGGRPSDIKFVSYSNAAKPNTKNTKIVRQKEILEELLSENSPAYNRRKSRTNTKNSYQKSLLGYFIIMIHNNSR